MEDFANVTEECFAHDCMNDMATFFAKSSSGIRPCSAASDTILLAKKQLVPSVEVCLKQTDCSQFVYKVVSKYFSSSAVTPLPQQFNSSPVFVVSDNLHACNAESSGSNMATL